MAYRALRPMGSRAVRLSSSWYPASVRTIQSLRPVSISRCLHAPTTALSQSRCLSAQHSDYPTATSTEKRSPQTLTEKIVQRYAVGLPPGKLVRSGDFISIEPAAILTHDNSFPVMTKFMSMGATKIHRPDQLVMALDHDVQNTSEANLRKYQNIEAFAKTHGISFYPAGRGIGHQVMVEEGHAWPGTMTVASDSHSTHYGGIGCLGTPVVRSDASSVWATGRTWWCCPPVARVTFTGTLPPGVTGKDIIVALCGIFKSDVLNHVVEFTGPEETMESLRVDTRVTIANMSCEWGALAGIFPIDRTLERWLRYKATEAAMLSDRTTRERITHERVDELFANPVTADPDAVYAKQLYLNLSTLSPYVSGPNSVKVATPLNTLMLQSIKVDRAYIISCTNSRASDIRAAAKVFRDAAEANGSAIPKVANGVQLYIAAASAPEQEAAEATGDWQVLLEAGAQPLPAGCGPCIGLGKGLLEPGEVGISASNRNFKGRMGSRDAKAYLASPEVVAASALHGVITGPGVYKVPEGWSGVDAGYGTGLARTTENELSGLVQQLDSFIDRVESAAGASNKVATKILPGFPEKISGEIVFCDADNVDTDAIYPGKLTYQDNVSREDMAKACFSNYDPEFDRIAKPNDILVSGEGFGCGSSREQAATAILARDIPLVVAASFGNVFSRNSINNALMGLEVPRLVERLRAHFSTPAAGAEERILTRRTGWTLTWDVKRSLVEVTEGPGGETWTEQVGELPVNVQEIIAVGGLEAWVKAELAKTT
ncbi:homoaconitase [Dactylonectria estremocensis]|uniref:Homoaconitase, mitochondrial n=1 Tax=Dactylonectria estremocensis TaxID=1079267 RepID=A0A9P9J5Y3_9HYPO|nr:homoaconitase [Dactylonectria estremocensis]